MFKILISFFLMMQIPGTVLANEVAGSVAPKNPSGPGTVKLPLCVDEKETLDKIKQVATANKKSNHKYNGYREALRNDTDVELMTRLAYAETLAAQCADKNSVIGPKIIETIGNRVERRRGNVRDVIFERDQFASSLNFYGASKYQDFLCPRDAKLWGTLYKAAENRLQVKTVTANSAINYFLYKHSPQWTKEPWKLPEEKVLTTPDIRDCIRFFQVPQWK